MAPRSPGPRFSRDLPPYRGVLAVDLERFTETPSVQLPRLVEAVPRVLETALRRSGLDWADRRFPQGTGDGYVLGLPAECTPQLLHPFLDVLQQVLQEENAELRAHGPGLRMRMRVSVHLGPLPDSRGNCAGDGVGKAMNDTHRLLDCRPLRDALARTDPDVTFVAAIVSQRVYADVVEAGFTALRQDQLIPVRAEVKNFSEDAWMHVPVPSGRALRDGFGGRPDTEAAIDEAAAARDEAPAARDEAPAARRSREEGASRVQRTGDVAGISLQSDSVVNSTFVTNTVIAGVLGVHPAPDTEIDLARRHHTERLGVGRARELLRRRHMVVLAAAPGGCRTTALHLLDELSLETGISLLDVVKRWDRPSVGHLPLHSGCGYLLDLNSPATDRPDAAFAEDLAVHAARLVDRGSYLVITARPELWRDCRARAEPFTVALAAAPAADVPALAAGPRDAARLRVVDPDGDETEFPLAGRDEVRVGRPFGGETPDIAIDSDLVSREPSRLVRDRHCWWLHPCAKNPPLLGRRGAGDLERVAGPVRLEHGDVICVQVRPTRVDETRHWRLEFTDPLHTPIAFETPRGDAR